MSKVYDFTTIPKHTGESEYYDFVTWWNKKYKNKMELNEDEQNPFTTSYILYQFYLNSHESIDESIIKRIKHNLKPSVDKLSSIIPEDFDVNQKVKYTRENMKKGKTNQLITKLAVKYCEILAPDDIQEDAIMHPYDIYKNKNGTDPTFLYIYYYALRSIIEEYLSSFINLDTEEITTELLDNELLNLNEENYLGYIIPEDIQTKRPKTYNELKTEYQNDKVMEQVFDIVDGLLIDTGRRDDLITINSFAKIINLLLENSVPFPDVKVVE